MKTIYFLNLRNVSANYYRSDNVMTTLFCKQAQFEIPIEIGKVNKINYNLYWKHFLILTDP